MYIEGLQKLTLLDYPEKMACTVFTHGCNFRCPFCHNASLVIESASQRISIEELKEFFQKRKGILDGVCITGGEPLLQKDIKEFIELIKSYGYLVKLDTNGSYPEKLKELVGAGILDYVAMDVKASPEKYSVLTGIDGFDITPISESISFLKEGKVPYEFRTTVVKEFHEPEDFVKIGEWIKGCDKYYLQQFVDSGDVISGGLSAYTPEEMEEIRQKILPLVPVALLRGV